MELSHAHKGGDPMEMIIGGAFQGKTEYARRKHPQIVFADGGSMDPEQAFTVQGINHFEGLIRRLLLAGEDPFSFAERLIRENPDIVIISREIGYGVVPVDRFERDCREAVGRICTRLAAESDKVTRVICGIGSVIKERGQLCPF